VIVRPFNNFGPRRHHGGDSGEVIPRFAVWALNGWPPVIFGDGRQTRDFLYVADTRPFLLLLFPGPIILFLLLGCFLVPFFLGRFLLSLFPGIRPRGRGRGRSGTVIGSGGGAR
jgi:hypothetical protein